MLYLRECAKQQQHKHVSGYGAHRSVRALSCDALMSKVVYQVEFQADEDQGSRPVNS
jgi:hypothetical protein